MVVLLSSFTILVLPVANAYVLHHHHHHHHHHHQRRATQSSLTTALTAKRTRKQPPKTQDPDDLNRWYDSVDADASPDDVFWEEMERQRLLSQIGSDSNSNNNSNNNSNSNENGSGGMGGSAGMMGVDGMNMGGLPTSGGGGGFASTTSGASSSSSSSSNSGSSSQLSRGSYTPLRSSAALSNNGSNGNGQQQMMGPGSPRSVEATLSEYEVFAVSDNWLDDEWVFLKNNNDEFDIESARPLEEQLDDWENENESPEDENAWMQSEEPWDLWGETKEEIESREVQRMNSIKSKATDFLLKDDDDEDDKSEMEREKAEFELRLSKLRISSRRLAQARNSPKAPAFFAQEPDALEGYDRLWVAAIDNVCFKNLVGIFRNYGIQFADNFGDWKDGCIEDGLSSIEDIASFKARQVYKVTGLPCIASRTSFEIEPVPSLNTGSSGVGGRAVMNANPRVVSGYQFNDIGMHVDYICDALRPLSEPSRVTRMKTCLCYYDGEMEIYDYGVCDVDLVFANSMRTFIPVAQAINEMINTLELTFGLEYQAWLKSRIEEANSGFSGASMKLRDRVLKDGRVLPNDIVDVSDFMDSQVDVNLMDECARDLSARFMSDKPTKILTVATTGLVIALPMAKYLQVPVVYARKERSVVMADTYKAGFFSNTVGKNRELIVSKQHLHEDDRVLIIDDFLSSGASQEALLRIVSESGATAVGVGVLLEKVYDSGRQSLSGYDVPVHSLCRIASVKSGVIQLVEEEGFERMQKSN
jgi:xanthine phosphoribosyltransferase